MAVRKKTDPFDASSPLLPGDSYHEQLTRAMAAAAQPPPLLGTIPKRTRGVEVDSKPAAEPDNA